MANSICGSVLIAAVSTKFSLLPPNANDCSNSLKLAVSTPIPDAKACFTNPLDLLAFLA